MQRIPRAIAITRSKLPTMITQSKDLVSTVAGSKGFTGDGAKIRGPT